MIAFRRADVAELNAVARTLLDREGGLGRERHRLDNGLELAAGDRVVCTRNDRRLGVANGSRGTVVAVDPAARTAALELDDRRRLTLPNSYLDAGHLKHAYALTGHKTQGLTVEQAFVLAHGHGHLKEWGYVALTRSRGQTRLYTTAAELEPDAPPHRPEPAGPVDRLAQALARPAADTLAIDAVPMRPGSAVPGAHTRLVQQTRALAEHCRALEKQRAETAQHLHSAKQELEELGLIGRARHGPRLRAQISARREELASLDAERGPLERGLRASRQRALEYARCEPARPRRALTRERGLERGSQLDLAL